MLRSPRLDSTISIEAAPQGSEITIDGKKAVAGSNKVVAGKHTVKVALEGFEAQDQNITTTTGQNSYAGFVLSSNSADTKNWYKENADDQKLSETIGSHLSDYTGQAATQQNTLLQELPVIYGDGHGGVVNIDSGAPLADSSQPAIYVSADTPEDRQGALEWMRSHDYNPATMDIVFSGVNLGFNVESGE